MGESGGGVAKIAIIVAVVMALIAIMAPQPELTTAVPPVNGVLANHSPMSPQTHAAGAASNSKEVLRYAAIMIVVKETDSSDPQRSAPRELVLRTDASLFFAEAGLRRASLVSSRFEISISVVCIGQMVFNTRSVKKLVSLVSGSKIPSRLG